MKLELKKINGTKRDRYAVIVKPEESIEDAKDRLFEKVAGKGARHVKNSGVKGMYTAIERGGNVVGEYWLFVDGE